ncbi:MAG: phytanoyl-CoA dioxygenase family protein [candidate division Zixibacteria bacterium]|nr:phytanoyl-CoA dioxygenase family protein [candidate division Zixibacteria bacterium]
MYVSRTEIDTARLSPPTLCLALQDLHERGYVILENALPVSWVHDMRLAFDEALLKLVDGKPPQAHGGGSPPMIPPFLDPLIIEHPMAVQIVEASMGEGVFSYLPYGCNTAWPGSPVQWIHRDSKHLFPEVPYALPPATLVVNIPLVDFTLENGCTELWPGSHLIVDTDPDIISDPYTRWSEEKASLLPSVRTVMPAGSVVVRDMRVLHRGMPNRTNIIRSMIALVYFRRFHRLPSDIPCADLSGVWDGLSERARMLYRYSNCPGPDRVKKS